MTGEMHSQQQSVAPARPATPRAAARQTNNDATLLSHPLKRLSLHTAAHMPLPQSPGAAVPSTPNFGPKAVRRSPSTASMRSSSPALGRKSSTGSLRGDVPRPGTPRSAQVSRRSSFAPNMQSPIPKSPLGPSPPEEKLPLRACDVAEEHFRKELARHDAVAGAAGAVHAGTVVIVHDQCYGHRFSRPKTPKSTLGLIMERPERILASVLGIATAYVRLGARHAEGSHGPHPHDDLPERIPFQIRKTSRVVDITSQVVTNVHGTRWMAELQSLCHNAERKLASTGKELARDTAALPGQAAKRELHAGDLYLCAESLNAFQGALGGVLDAVDAVFQGTSTGNGPSRAFVCVRPPGHHCSHDFPSGFCWLNNVHVGIEHAMVNYGLTHAAIVDFDLHHGDGSQAITWARNKKVQNMHKNTPNWKKTSIGYFSLHDINSYPCEDGDDDKVQAASLCIDNAHGQSIWNVHLQSWKTPEQFWAIYEDKYMVLIQKTRQYLRHHTNRLRAAPNHPAPKAAIFLSAGFDASEWETAGMQRHSVNVPTEFYARFTRDVVRLAEEEGTSVQGRVVSVLEGGYSDRALTSGVLSHLSGLVDGQVWTDPKPSTGLAVSMRQRLGGPSMSNEDVPVQSVEAEPTLVSYDPLWWHATQLSELENLVNPPPAVAPKKPRTGPGAHFSSPTQSFVAKVVDPTKIGRSLSAKYASSPSRAPTPPPPEVDWATAAHALSSLLIPSDRQTHSHKPEDLAEVKAKKEKAVAPMLSSVHVDGSGRQLRGRKAAPSYADPAPDDEKASLRTESRSSRRQTIADFALATSEPQAPSRSVSRRVSIASSVSSIGDNRSVSREPSAPAGRRSAAPSAAPANGVPVKKARGPTAAAAARAPQRPPVPRISSNYSSRSSASKDKENDSVDALTSGLKRITLKLPPKEEYEAREKAKEEKQKAVEVAKKTTTRKPPAARAPTTKPPAATSSTTTKRAAGRAAKSSKPVSPLEGKASTPAPEVPKVESAAAAPLIQPQPISLESASVLPDSGEVQAATEPPAVDRRISGGIIQPPTTDLHDLAMTPEQLREQLPMPSFVTVTEPVKNISPPPRADTPPPPPPSNIPQFVNYTAQSFSTTATFASPTNESDPQASATLQWVSNTHAESADVTGGQDMSPASKRGGLPVFTANGAIPFASSPNGVFGQQGAAAQVREEEAKDIWEVPDTPAR
ncbi:Arginase/deacetylase [Decorospora gaudefroyi]|uniref:Arginase/deacetylase n=1 Tax=Decorospora gaudefroyi TaxID=184978 RepID=A0A6A5JYN5_9PLEO|nr:Arginase/deacetylase [Decorospora gaudefroyi]